MTPGVRDWWHGRTPRERQLLTAAAAALGLAVALRGGSLVAGDLAAARARVAGQEHDLLVVRRLAGDLARERRSAADAGDTPLVTRLEAAAAEVVGRERIASMTPVVGSSDGVAMRLVGASLGEVVRILHEIEGAGSRVLRLDLVKHPDDPSRFDVAVEIAGRTPP